MKTFKKSFLPDSVSVNGIELKMNGDISSTMSLNNTSPSRIAAELKKEGRLCALVIVTNKNLKGKTDLHGKPYPSSKWIFTN